MSSRGFDEMDRMFEQMDQLFARMRSRLAESEFGPALPEMRWGRSVAVDVVDDEDTLLVVADLPGYEPDEIDVSIRGTVLHIAAEHEPTEEHGGRHRSVSERVTVPAELDHDEIVASYRNGVLEVCLPYSTEHEDAHHIDID